MINYFQVTNSQEIKYFQEINSQETDSREGSIISNGLLSKGSIILQRLIPKWLIIPKKLISGINTKSKNWKLVGVLQNLPNLTFIKQRTMYHTTFISGNGLLSKILSYWNWVKSISTYLPSNINSLIALPAAGDCCIPCPLKPFMKYKLLIWWCGPITQFWSSVL